MCRLFGIVAYASILFGSVSLRAQSFHAERDFQYPDNPNGQWSYGWQRTLEDDESFSLLPPKEKTGSGLERYGEQVVGGQSSLYHNPEEYEILDSLPYPPHVLTLHPGDAGQYAVLRWTAVEAGEVNVFGSFQRLDHREESGGTNTDVHLRGNTPPRSVYSGIIDASNPQFEFTTRLPVEPGDYISFAVGYGPDRDYHTDTTGVCALISYDPPGDLYIDGSVDGKVDLNDLNAVRNGFGATGWSLDGDANCDINVDLDDLNLVRNNFGEAAGASTVPEPSGMILVAIGSLFSALIRRRYFTPRSDSA